MTGTSIPRYARELGYALDPVLPFSIPTGAAPHSLCIDGAAGIIGVSCSNMPGAQFFSLTTGALVASVSTSGVPGSNPLGICFDAVSGLWALADFGGNAVVLINPATWTIQQVVPCGAGPRDVKSDATGVWVTESTANTVSHISRTTWAIDHTLPLAGQPYRMDFDGVRFLYVGCGTGNTLAQIDTLAPSVTWNNSTNAGPWGVLCGIPFIHVTCFNGGGAVNCFLPSGACQYTSSFTGVSGSPHDLVRVHDTLWIANANGNNLIKMGADGGRVIDVLQAGKDTAGMAFDGVAVWNTCYVDNTIERRVAVEPIT